LFFDEATRGIDSAAALSLVSMLKLEIVKKLGITACFVVHPPRKMVKKSSFIQRTSIKQLLRICVGDF
jgi:ABC-type multidrug transport system ATPase subunit